MSLDDIIWRLRKAEEAAFMRGDGDTYTLLLAAGSKLVEASKLADFIIDAADYDEPSFEVCVSVADKATNFLCSRYTSA
jgi:hypothetical protein